LIQSQGGSKNIAISIWGNHLHTFSDTRPISSMNVKIPSMISAELPGRPSRPLKTTELGYLHEYTTLEPGTFWANQDAMNGIFDEMVKTGRIPTCKMRNFIDYKSLQLNDGVETTVLALPSSWETLQEWAANISLAMGKSIMLYNGEGMASFSLSMLIALLKPQRERLAPVQGSCEICGGSSLLERDHRVACSLGGGNKNNTQLLCSLCHLDKTRSESDGHLHYRGAGMNPMLSFFNKSSYNSYMASCPKQVVNRINKPKLESSLVVDVKRCRRSALTSGYSFPAFCSLDEIQPFKLRHL
jgi:hypothetical protein